MTDGSALTPEELDAETGTALPAKEAMSLLDLNADLDLALDLAAPVDAAIAANANVAAPIDAAASANVLSLGSVSAATTDQESLISQNLEGVASATAEQDATMLQGAPVDGGAADAPSAEEVLAGDADLLNVNVDLALDADVAAPIDAAVAANANVAAPINAAVSANIGSIDSVSVADADQSSVIVQNLEAEANANAAQDVTIDQAD